jgi:hypothetical protein
VQQILHIPSDRQIYLKTGRLTSSQSHFHTIQHNCHTVLFSDNYRWQQTWHHTDKRRTTQTTTVLYKACGAWNSLLQIHIPCTHL